MNTTALVLAVNDTLETIRAWVTWDEAGSDDLVDQMQESPLEVIDERGREFAVVLTIGGPHIEVHADGNRDAALTGYWGSETYTVGDPVLNEFMDWFIDRGSATRVA